MELLKQHVSPTRILDVGAHGGESYALFRQAWPQAKIMSVEANPACERALRASGADYRIALLWSEQGTTEFYRTREDVTSTGCSVYRELTHHFRDEMLEVLRLPCTTLDTLFPGEAFDFIKLDTQGSELEILRGGWKLLRHAKHLLLEVSLIAYNAGAPLRPEVDAALERMGFFPVVQVGEDRNSTGELIQEDILYASKV
jgi:FkbM family methyltransferase